MKNEKMKNIIDEEITDANLPENVSIEISFHGNGAFLIAFDNYTASWTYNVTYCGVTTTKHETHPARNQIGFGGKKVWGIQGEQGIRKAIRQYLEYVARLAD